MSLPRPALAVLLLGCVAKLAAAEDSTAKSAPTVLPKVKVNAEVPLVKVADFQLAEKRSGAAAVVLGDYVYVIGGTRGGVPLGSVERFDPRTGKSAPFARLKQARFGHGAVVLDGKIHVLGGYPHTDPLLGPTASVEIIDPVSGQVSAGRGLPEARAGFACAVVGRQLYVLGGHLLKRSFSELDVEAGSGGHTESTTQVRILAYTNTVAVFDAATGRWREGPPMPVAGETVAVVVGGASIVTAGGFDAEGLRKENVAAGTWVDDTHAALDQVAALNPSDQTWRIQPPLHLRARGHSLAFLGHYLFLFGAKDREDELIAYDLKTRSSESFTLGYKRALQTTAVVYRGLIYVIGGEDAGGVAADYIQVFGLRRATS